MALEPYNPHAGSCEEAGGAWLGAGGGAPPARAELGWVPQLRRPVRAGPGRGFGCSGAGPVVGLGLAARGRGMEGAGSWLTRAGRRRERAEEPAGGAQTAS